MTQSSLGQKVKTDAIMWMQRQIWVFTGCTGQKVQFHVVAQIFSVSNSKILLLYNPVLVGFAKYILINCLFIHCI